MRAPLRAKHWTQDYANLPQALPSPSSLPTVRRVSSDANWYGNPFGADPAVT